jgi:two-component system KDP operon response regulator KdpE
MNKDPLILIVEDEDAISNFISAILTSNHYNLVKTGKGREAISMAASFCPDLILLDLGLPDIDGIEVIKSVREFGFTSPILISQDNMVIAGHAQQFTGKTAVKL